MHLRAILAAAILAFLPAAADAAGKPGEFDYYVLSLSWSPSFCQIKHKTSGSQCGKSFDLVVHGLWPQYETNGWPQFCVAPPPAVSPRVMRQAMTFTPDSDLIKHEWAKHGTCSGDTANDYFAHAASAFHKIKAPVSFDQPHSLQTMDAAMIARLFITANPGMTDKSISVTCQESLLQEIRVCLDRNLNYRDCAPDVQAQACSTSMTLPPVK